MIDFIEYVVAELRGKRLSKENALSLIRQFSANTANSKTSALHPLLHRNTSSIDQQCYASSFTGDEFFLSDHRIVTGNTTSKVLPGVAYLEMARAAMKDAVPQASSTEQVQLYDVVWLQPIVVNEQQEVCIRLLAGDGSEPTDELDLDFEVFTTANAGEVIHCRGRAVFASRPAPEKLDVEALKARVSEAALDRTVIY